MGRSVAHTETNKAVPRGSHVLETPREATVQVIGPEVMARAMESLLRDNGIHVVTTGSNVVVLLPPAGGDIEANRAGCVVLTDGTDLSHRHPRGCRVWSVVGESEPVSALVAGIYAAARGEAYCSPQLLPVLLKAAFDIPNSRGQAVHQLLTEENPRTTPEQLSKREREVTHLAAEGQSNQEISLILDITVATVKFHLFHAFRKLGITRRSQLSSVLEASVSDDTD